MMIIFKEGPHNDGLEHSGILREIAGAPQGGTTIWIERHNGIPISKQLQMPPVMFRNIYASAEKKRQAFLDISNESGLMKHHPKAVKEALVVIDEAEAAKLNQILADYLDAEEAKAERNEAIAARVKEKFGTHATVEIVRKPPSERLLAIQAAAAARTAEVRAAASAGTLRAAFELEPEQMALFAEPEQGLLFSRTGEPVQPQSLAAAMTTVAHETPAVAAGAGKVNPGPVPVARIAPAPSSSDARPRQRAATTIRPGGSRSSEPDERLIHAPGRTDLVDETEVPALVH